MNDASDSTDREWKPPSWSRRAAGTSRAPENPNAVAVLVVDDDEAVRSTEADVLRTVGYTVIEASDEEDALGLLGTMRFDVMVLDHNMPGLNGLELLERVSKPPPVVSVSAMDLAEQVSARTGSLVVSWLVKPVPPRQLLEAVAQAVRIERPST